MKSYAYLDGDSRWNANSADSETFPTISFIASNPYGLQVPLTMAVTLDIMDDYRDGIDEMVIEYLESHMPKGCQFVRFTGASL